MKSNISPKQEKQYGEIKTEIARLLKEVRMIKNDVPLIIDKYEEAIKLFEELDKIKRLNVHNRAQLQFLRMTLKGVKRAKKYLKSK